MTTTNGDPMLTLELLLSMKEGQPADALDSRLAAEAERLAKELPAGPTVRLVHNLRHHRDDALRVGESLERFDEYVKTGLLPEHAKVPLTSFDAVVEISSVDDGDVDLLLDAVGGVADRLGPAVDTTRSAVVVGTDHVITDGIGAVQLFVCLQRVAGTTQRQFCDWWLHELVEHTTKTPGKSAYRQLHADPDLTRRAAHAAGVAIADIDGIALEFYPDLARFCAAVAWADQPKAAIAEVEAQMIDFSRARAILAYDAG